MPIHKEKQGMAAKMRINRRIVNSKRHTTGYIVTGGRRITRAQAVRMARKGELSGVRAIQGNGVSYIQSTTNRSLYDLPIEVDAGGRRR
tara:strand:- start:20022 stop:20288 length:267 start_codon:yes stop_codon:yes gene_type:complete